VTRLIARRPLVAVLTAALTAVGLLGTYRYWESYYQHRGFQTVAFLPHAQHGRLETITFYSQALHRRADYLVYLPPGYGQSAQRYPAYYLLHGSPGRPEVYLGIASMPVRMDNLISRHRMRPMILVMPDGRIGGSTYSDSEWANTMSGNYSSYVIDVMHDVDHRFQTIPNRRDRVIAGFSAGAYGATNVFLHNVRSFANLQSWSGYYLENRTGVFAGASRATLADNSPLDYIHRVAGEIARFPVRAFLFVGRDDDDSPQTKPMADALAAAGATVSYALYQGGHDWQLWHAHLDPMLILASQDTSEPLTRGGGVARTLTPGVVPIPHGEGRRHHRNTRLVQPAQTISRGNVAARNRAIARRHRLHMRPYRTSRPATPGPIV
jgi:enterochelin esterase-like enzyme